MVRYFGKVTSFKEKFHKENIQTGFVVLKLNKIK